MFYETIVLVCLATVAALAPPASAEVGCPQVAVYIAESDECGPCKAGVLILATNVCNESSQGA